MNASEVGKLPAPPEWLEPLARPLEQQELIDAAEDVAGVAEDAGVGEHHTHLHGEGHVEENQNEPAAGQEEEKNEGGGAAAAQMLQLAARIGDEIGAHSGASIGGILGGVLGGAAGIGLGVLAIAGAPVVVGLAGVAAAVVGMAIGFGAVAGAVGLTAFGAEAGRSIGEEFKDVSPCGPIEEGSANVFIENMPAAYRGKKIEHGGNLAQGSVNVFVNDANASRNGDLGDCGGKVVSHAKHTWFGGPPSASTANEAAWVDQLAQVGEDTALLGAGALFATTIGTLGVAAGIVEGVTVLAGSVLGGLAGGFVFGKAGEALDETFHTGHVFQKSLGALGSLGASFTGAALAGRFELGERMFGGGEGHGGAHGTQSAHGEAETAPGEAEAGTPGGKQAAGAGQEGEGAAAGEGASASKGTPVGEGTPAEEAVAAEGTSAGVAEAEAPANEPAPPKVDEGCATCSGGGGEGTAAPEEAVQNPEEGIPEMLKGAFDASPTENRQRFLTDRAFADSVIDHYYETGNVVPGLEPQRAFRVDTRADVQEFAPNPNRSWQTGNDFVHVSGSHWDVQKYFPYMRRYNFDPSVHVPGERAVVADISRYELDVIGVRASDMNALNLPGFDSSHYPSFEDVILTPRVPKEGIVGVEKLQATAEVVNKQLAPDDHPFWDDEGWHQQFPGGADGLKGHDGAEAFFGLKLESVTDMPVPKAGAFIIDRPEILAEDATATNETMPIGEPSPEALPEPEVGCTTCGGAKAATASEVLKGFAQNV